MYIDLHGLIETEAILALDSFLNDFDYYGDSEATIIVGRGIVLKPMVIDELNKRNVNWSYEGQNTGAIIIKR